jgi:DNA-binding transcriptional ArsR family regulator
VSTEAVGGTDRLTVDSRPLGDPDHQHNHQNQHERTNPMTTPSQHATTSTAEKIQAALAAHPDRTAAELADLTGLGRSTVTKQLAALERTGQTTRSPGPRTGSRRQPDRWMIPADTPAQRLRPGQLNELVLAYITDHADTAPHGTTTVARALSRSAGAVANCLERLTIAGRLRRTSSKPRRYALSNRRATH